MYGYREVILLRSIFLKVVCSLSFVIILIVPVSIGSVYCSNEDSGNVFSLKRLYLNAECFKIILYKPVGFPIHIGPVWFTSEHAYLAFIIEKEFVLRLDGVEQSVDVPVMVIPYRFFGIGPLFWVRNIVNPCDGNVTLVGWCENVVIHPLNSTR